jgi:hypothetical protein
MNSKRAYPLEKRGNSETLVQLVALAIVTFGLALGLALIAYLDGGM